MEDLVYELNVAGRAARPRGGAIAGPKDGTAALRRRRARADQPHASISPDVNDPGFRAVTFDELRDAYAEQVERA